MSPDQRKHYRAVLWPTAMQAQGWDKLPKDAQERLRRALTKEASETATGTVTDSTTLLNQDQIDVLWNLLKHYGAPLNLEKARKVANPDIAATEGKAKRLVFAINELGFHRNYVQAIAKWQCRTHQVSRWEDLPNHVLHNLIRTVNKNRLKKGMPDPKARRPRATGHPVKNYELRPRREIAPAGSDNIPY